MNEEPRSAAKSTRKKPRGYVALFAVLAIVAFCVMVVVILTTTLQHPFGEVLFGATLYSLVSALVLTLSVAFCRWLFCWRHFKRLLFGLACLITLIALWYLEEDLRGKHDWNSYKSALAAKGEKVEFTDYVPASVPDEQNFAMTPICIAMVKGSTSDKVARSWYGDRVDGDDVAKFLPLLRCTTSAITGTNAAKNTFPQPPDVALFWPTGGLVNLKPWQTYYRTLAQAAPAQVSVTPQPQSPAADVLLALGKYDPVIDQLRQDSQLPYCRFPVKYDIDDPAEILLPHLGILNQVAGVLELRGVAELQNNQPDRAFDDVKLMMHLNDSYNQEPFAITLLVRVHMLQMALQVIYEGLSRHQWTDAQLAEMDADLAKLDYLAECRYSITSESFAHAKMVGWLEQKRSRVWDFVDVIRNNPTPIPRQEQFQIAVAFYAMPKGWFYQADKVMTEGAQAWVSSGTINDVQQIISPSQVLQNSNTVEQIIGERTLNFIGRMLSAEWSTFVRRTAYGQTSANLALVAIALERYHLAHGEFPESLDALSPPYLEQVPHDLINGEPLQYRRTADGQFILYSVGWNETDEGGQVSKSANYMIGEVNGDWVWQYPQK